MIIKRLIRPDRLRQVPPSFSWVDHRLVSARFIERCDPPSLGLYLFLVTVADIQGLSFYSDASIGRYLRLDAVQLSAARQQLERAGLIAFHKPLYQVLALDSPAGPPAETAQRTNQAHSVAEILRRVTTGGAV
jgi:hypothetical protein